MGDMFMKQRNVVTRQSVLGLKTTRRTFIKQAALAGAVGPFIHSHPARGENGRKLRHACIGVGGQRGGVDMTSIDNHPDVEVVALCDVDRVFLEHAARRHPNARLYRDWRELLEKEADNIDSVNIATTNHTHAPIAMTALRLDKHVYCQKPLTHSIHESRMLAEEAARRPHLVTQMGVQTHSAAAYRTAVAMIQYGIIGKVKEAHSWDRIRFHYTGAFMDPPMERRPLEGDPVPENLDWDLWLAVAPERAYKDELYHVRMWRRWHDFGGGAHGDMAGHMMDVVFTALELTAPESIMSHRSPPFEDTYSPNNLVEHRFPATPFTDGPLDYFWHDTTEIDTEGWPVAEADLPGNGSMLFGERGVIFLPHGGQPQVFPAGELDDVIASFNEQVGPQEELDHYHQFVDACLGRDTPTTPFSYSGNMTETVLMGNIANRFPMERLDWNASGMEFTNKPEANQYLRRAYRDGWKIEGLG